MMFLRRKKDQEPSKARKAATIILSVSFVILSLIAYNGKAFSIAVSGKMNADNVVSIIAAFGSLFLCLSLLAVGAGGFALFKWLSKRGELPDVSGSTVHGSAGFAEDSQIWPYVARGEDHRLIVGRLHDDVEDETLWIGLTQKQQESHILVVGPTGQGKSTGIIIPGLLKEPGDRSVFAIDPKSELYRLTAGAAAQDLQVWRFAPTDPRNSNSYNPLAYIETMEDAQDFSTAWIDNTGRSSKNPFFDRNTEALVTSTVLHLRAAEPSAPLARLAQLLTLPWQKLQTILEHSPSAAARQVAGPLLANIGKNQNLISGLMTDLANRFFLLQDAQIQATTATNEIDFREMSEGEATALYLCISSSQAERLKPLSATFLMQMFRTWIRQAEQTGNLAQPVACYLDEFANVGRIPHFEQYIAILRSMRVSLLLAIQGFSQLDALYTREVTPTLLANATTHLVLPGCGLFECKYYSERMGDTTIEVINEGRVYNSWTPTHTRNQQQVKRRLMNPDEIRTMPQGQILMIAGNEPPLVMAGAPYYEDEEESELARIPAPAIRRRNPAAMQPAPLVRSLPTTGPTNRSGPAAAQAVAQQYAAPNYPYSAPAAMQPAPQYQAYQQPPQTGPTVQPYSLSQSFHTVPQRIPAPPPPPMSSTGSVIGSLPQQYQAYGQQAQAGNPYDQQPQAAAPQLDPYSQLQPPPAPTGQGNPYQTYQASNPYSSQQYQQQQPAPQLDPYSQLQPPAIYRQEPSQQRPPTDQQSGQYSQQQRPPTVQPPAYTFPYHHPATGQQQRPPTVQPPQQEQQPASGQHPPAPQQQEPPPLPTGGQFKARTNKHPTAQHPQRPPTGGGTGGTDPSGPFSLLP